MHSFWLQAFLIAVCTVSSVIDSSFVGGSEIRDDNRYSELERPTFCVLFWGFSMLCYPSALDEDKKRNLRLQIKEESSEKWQNISDDREAEEPRVFEWRKFVNSTTKYRVRAVMNGTSGPELEFYTNCTTPSNPTDLEIIFNENRTVDLIWHHEYVIPESSEYCVELVGSGSNDSPMAGPPIWNLYHADEKQPHQSIRKNNYFAVVSINGPGEFIQLVDQELPLSRIDIWSGENLTNPTYLPNITYGQRNSSIEVTINQLTDHGKPMIPSKTVFAGSALMSNHTTFDGPAPLLHPHERYIIEVIVRDPISNVSASIKIKFMRCQTSSLLIWMSITIFTILLLSFSCIGYWWYKSRHAGTKGSMLVVKYRNSYRLMSESTDSPYKFSAYLSNLREFERHVKDAAENGILEFHFRSLPNGLRRPCMYGKLPENKPKNRYGNLIPYDETRVILDRGRGQQYSDYINANYIQGYSKEKAYIATQGPLPETIVDFWRMIWQEKVHIICMLVDLFEGGQKMCDQYWPEVEGKMEYGNIIVSNVEQHVFAHYTYRTFWLSTRFRRELRKVEHLQYTGWPAEGIPMYSHSIAEYLTKLLSIPVGQGPIVMHCSGGTGRTGAIILCDITLRHFAAEEKVNVFVEAKKMYKARANMLRNFSEYVLAYLVPSYCLLFLPTKVPCHEISLVKMAEMKIDLPVHMKRLEECSWMDKALRPLGPLLPPRPENLLKNRFPKLTPVTDRLVTLTRYPTYDEHSSYISAVNVDGVKLKNQYLASQLPLPSTLTDFWRLVIEKNVELVVLLQRPDPEDETCCAVVPHRTTVIPMPNIKVESRTRINYSKHFTTDILLLTDNSVKPARARSITALTCNKWNYDKDAKPPAPEALVALWIASENIRRVEGPTLVLCHDGVTGCGLYLAMSFMLERMAVERECDVILAVRAVRRSRPEFVHSKSQFEYLYDAAEAYSETFRTYDNFR